MVRKCDIETPDDFLRYYNGGWLGLPNTDGTIAPICGYNSGKSDRALYVYRIVNDSAGLRRLPDLERIDWETLKEKGIFGRPTLGMVKNYGTISFGSLVAERNSRRGLTISKMYFYHFNDWALRKKYPEMLDSARDYRWDLIWNYFNPTYFGFTEAFNKLEDGELVGAVLSPTYGLYSTANCPHPLVAYKRWTVGYAERYVVSIHRRFREYQEEVQELVKAEVRII